MTRERYRRLSWAIAMAMTLAIFLAVFLKLDFRYAQNDDAGILRSFMGYETGKPAHFHIYIHGLLAWPLYALALAFPGVAWFSVLQIALLCFADVLIAKSIMQCFVKHDQPFWLGALFAAMFLTAFALSACAHITFTLTSALLGAAAVLQMFSVDYERASDGAVVRGLLLALAPALLAYALRQITALPVLAFCGLGFAMIAAERFGFGKARRRALKPMLVSLLAVVLAMGGMAGVRAWEIASNDAGDYLAWQDATAEILDYQGTQNLTPEALADVGWSENTRLLVNDWFFLDPDISTEAFETLAAYQRGQEPAQPGARLSGALGVLGGFARTETDAMRSAMLLLLVMALCVFGAVTRKGRTARLLTALGVTLTLLAAMLLYLALEGRLPTRAVMTALLPAAGLLFALLPACLPKPDGGRRLRSALAVLTALCVAQTVYYAAGAVPGLLRNEAAAEIGEPVADLDEYALSEPDMLFIHDSTLAIDTRLFPDTSEGIPHNVTYWGGWGLGSRESIEQFANFGIDLADFPAETFLREDVCLASGVIDPPPEKLLAYLREKVDPSVDYTIYSEYGNVHFFQFYLP